MNQMLFRYISKRLLLKEQNGRQNDTKMYPFSGIDEDDLRSLCLSTEKFFNVSILTVFFLGNCQVKQAIS